MSKRRANEAYDAELRIDAVVDLASQLATEAYYHVSSFEPLVEFIEHLLDDGAKHPSLELLAKQAHVWFDGDDDDDSEVTVEQAGESLAERFFGVALRLATPQREYRSENSWRSGYGISYTRWVYAETLEQAWALGLEWASERHRSDLERFNAKEGGAA